MPTTTALKKMPETSTAMSATRTLLTKLGVDLSAIQPAGAIPIYDSDHWVWVYNRHGLAPGVENMADPVKVEQLRRSAAAVVNAFPETIEHLVKMGYRQVRSLLSKPIKTREQVIAWAESPFNWGPGVESAKPVVDAILLAHKDFQPVHAVDGNILVTVVPDAPLGSGNTRVKVIDAPPDTDWGLALIKGKEIVLGPRHEVSKAAYAGQNGASPSTEAAEAPQTPATAQKATKAPATAKKATRKPTAAPTGRPRGRPRADGLVSGSPEAKAADAAKKAAAKKKTTGQIITPPAKKAAAVKKVAAPKPADTQAPAKVAAAKKIIRRVAATAS